MSPEKSRVHVVRLCIESDARDKWRASILECKRQCYREAKALKRLMRNRRARQNLVPKARTKKELAEQKADEEKPWLLPEKCTMTMDMNGWCNMPYSVDVTERCAHAKNARLERLLRDAGGKWRVCLRYIYLGFFLFLKGDF